MPVGKKGELRTNFHFGVCKKTLIEFRKVLFIKGISFQEFILFVIDLVSMGDPLADEILKKAKEAKRERLKNGNVVARLIDAESVYDIIQSKLDHNNSNNNADKVEDGQG